MTALTLTLALLSVTLGAVAVCAFGVHRVLRRYRCELARIPALKAENERLTALRESPAAWQEERRHLEVQLHETQRELGTLAYSVAHDLRAPLRGIDGFSAALAEDFADTLDATAQDYLRRVRANSICMSKLLDDLLGLSQITTAPFSPEFVDVSALCLSLTREIGASDLSRIVRWNIQPGMTARGDFNLLASALRHLLENAWRFTSARPAAAIGVRACEPSPEWPGRTVLEVSDDGIGFDMQYAGKLFGAFQRMHAPEEFPGGRGIGLAAVQRIIRRHGGTVWAQAAPGHGAAFSFTLEAATSQDAIEGGALAAMPLVSPVGSAPFPPLTRSAV